MDAAGFAFVFKVTEYIHVVLGLILGEEGRRAHQARVAVAIVTSVGLMVIKDFPMGKCLRAGAALKRGHVAKDKWKREEGRGERRERDEMS